jgi:hypothetical protein
MNLIELAGVDQAHEQVPHLCSLPGPVKQRVLAMPNGLLQRPFHDIVGEGRQLRRMTTRPILSLKSSTHTIR